MVRGAGSRNFGSGPVQTFGALAQFPFQVELLPGGNSIIFLTFVDRHQRSPR
jgi:hypothetical protein